MSTTHTNTVARVVAFCDDNAIPTGDIDGVQVLWVVDTDGALHANLTGLSCTSTADNGGDHVERLGLATAVRTGRVCATCLAGIGQGTLDDAWSADERMRWQFGWAWVGDFRSLLNGLGRLRAFDTDTATALDCAELLFCTARAADAYSVTHDLDAVDELRSGALSALKAWRSARTWPTPGHVVAIDNFDPLLVEPLGFAGQACAAWGTGSPFTSRQFFVVPDGHLHRFLSDSDIRRGEFDVEYLGVFAGDLGVLETALSLWSENHDGPLAEPAAAFETATLLHR